MRETPDDFNGLKASLVRDNGSLFAVTRIILHALVWGLSLTIIPGIAGWHLLRRRPLQRIRSSRPVPDAEPARPLDHGRGGPGH